ncbi:MAG: EAL domain-containing protein [Vulcanimicrobiaceae bacterium]
MAEIRLAVAGARPQGNGHQFPSFSCDVTKLEFWDEMARRERVLNEAERIAQLGSYEEDLKSGTIWSSDGLCHILGLDPSTFRGTHAELMARVHPDDRELVLGHHRALVAGGGPYDYEHRIVRPDGEVRIARRRGYAVLDGSRHAIRICSTVLDITDRRRADAERHDLEIRFQGAFARAPIGMSLASIQPASFGRILQVNEAYCALTGYTSQELLSMDAPSLVQPDDRDAAVAVMNDLIAGRTTGTLVERRTLRRDGTAIWVRQHHSIVRDDDGLPLYAFSHSEDISRQRADEAVVVEASRRLRHSFENAAIGMALVSVDKADFGRYLDVNAALCQLLGYEKEQLLTLGTHVVMDCGDVEEDKIALQRLIAGDHDSYEAERRYVRSDGQIVSGILHRSLVRDANGNALYSISQLVDITRRKLAEENLRHLADHDPLTGLLNRRGFVQRLEQHIAEARRYDRCSAVLLIDLDRFKYINDTLGHTAGDEMLQMVARELAHRCHSSDIFARLGGNEFAVLLRDVDATSALHIADRVRREIKEKVQLGRDRQVHVSASIGVVTIDKTTTMTGQELLAAADIAMYHAKEAGRDRSCAFSSVARSHATMQSELAWSERVRSALRNNSFELYQQPILNLLTTELDHHELLLRMRDDDGNIIVPGAFLKAAERFGLMQEIDKWVVREAIRFVSAEERAGRTVRVEVNLAGPSLNDAGVMACIEQELQRTGIEPSSLVFEVTETEAIGNMLEGCRFAQRLADLGCAFALDDFGAGFSSLSYLKSLPFTYLKIDGQFIQNLSESAADREIVKAVVQMAAGLGKKTIAEFVGDDATLDLLREYGVNFAQGYRIGKPRPLAEFHAAPTRG